MINFGQSNANDLFVADKFWPWALAISVGMHSRTCSCTVRCIGNVQLHAILGLSP